MSRRTLIALLTLTTLAAAFLRIWRLTEIPPGLHYDIAADALTTQAVAFQGYRPVFVEAFTGHEPLFYYWAALWMRLIGPSVFALRLSAAMMGVLANPATYFAVRQLFYFDRHSRWQAALTAAILGFAFIHLTWSRFGLRAITQPTLQALALGFLFRGLNLQTSDLKLQTSNRPLPYWSLKFGFWNFVIGGVFTGLTAYTYLASRMFPIPLAVGLLAFALFRIRSIRNRQSPIENPKSDLNPLLFPYFLYFLTSFLIFLPLGYYFLTHPDSFFNRATQLVPGVNERGLLLYSIRRALEMIFIFGEPYDRFNIPGRPIFGPVLGFFFVIGVIISIKRVLLPSPLGGGAGDEGKPGGEGGLGGRAANLLLLVWLPVFLIPTALSIHDIFPSNVRAIGELPLLALFPARGLVATASWLKSRLTRIGALKFEVWSFPALPSSFFLLTLLSGTLTTYHSYFDVWANLPTQYLNNESDLAHVARWLNARDTSATEIYVSAFHYRHPALAFLARDFSRIQSIFQGSALPLPPDGEAALYVFPRSAPVPAEWTAKWNDHLIAAEPGPDGVPDFYAYQFAPGESIPLPDFAPVTANFANLIELQGFRVVSSVPGDSATLDLLWQVLNPPDTGDLRFVADLTDAWNFHWTQSFNDAYPSEQWQSDDRLVTRLTFDLPPGLPPGDYSLAVTLFAPSTHSNLSALNFDGTPAAFAFIGPVTIAPTVNVNLSPVPWTHTAENTTAPLQLLGFDAPPATARPGDPLPFALYIYGRASPPALATGASVPAPSFTLQLQPGSIVLETGAPVQGTLTQMSPAEFIVDRHAPRLPRDLPPGDYTLELLLPGGVQTIGNVSVSALDRLMIPPASPYPADFTFGDLIALSGFSLDPDPPLPGQPFTLTLNWQSRAPTDSDYSVFVHLLNADGSIAAQSDSRPRSGEYPTYLWLPGEYVSDSYTFTLNSGQYSLETGFYLPDTGMRLGAARTYEFTVP